MSVCYWGDLFYGINRITNGHIFDESKERDMIIKAMEHLNFKEETIEEYKEGFYLDFKSFDELESEDLIAASMFFLKEKIDFYHCYSCNEDISFFGISPGYPWQIKEIKTKEETNADIYNALKPILKDDITFEDVEPLIMAYSISGQDDFVTYHEYSN